MFVHRREKNYFIQFHLIYFIYAGSIVRNGWVHLTVEKTGRQDHLSLR